VLFHGQGAGRGPTTSAVMGDLIDIARRLRANEPPVPANDPVPAFRVQSIDDLETQYYIRLNIADQPGVLAQISRILGDSSISIASVLQKDTFPEEQKAELVITTHPARDASVREALRLVAELDVVKQVSNMLRIEG
ncbi:MAG: ACT domain-containing protein, partial [Chloroflexi bacterium]|nr:ACT domain-containing protein [Chloroflexota bacterium]